MRVLFHTCRPLISAQVAPPGAILTAGYLARAASCSIARRPLLARDQRQRGEHDHFPGGFRWAGRSAAKSRSFAKRRACARARAPLRRHQRLANLAHCARASGAGSARPAPELRALPGGSTIPSTCSRRPYLGEASEAGQELPPTTESRRVAVSP